MNESIKNILIKKKKISKKAVEDYLKSRIQLLDEQSENITILKADPFLYNRYIGKNTCVNCSLGMLVRPNDFKDKNLIEQISSISKYQENLYMIYDGDDKIIDLIYNNITENGYNEISLILDITKLVLSDIDFDKNGYKRTRLLLSNAAKNKKTKYSEIRSKHLGQCLENSVLFHNICQILGYDSQIISGTYIENELICPHAYNILIPSQQIPVRLLIDLTNPYFIDENGKKYIGISAAVITNEEYEKLINGEKIRKDMSVFTNYVCHTKLQPRYVTFGVGLTGSDKKMIHNFRLKTDKNYLGLFGQSSASSQHTNPGNK